ncbi:MAG: lysophospholipid acyltransferase family protein, partial [Candidatus Sumerlaeota bacterium]
MSEETQEAASSEEQEQAGVAYIILKYFYRYVLKIFFRLQAHGLEHVPETGGLLLVTNHASNLDPPIVGVYLPRVMHTMAKEELFKYPVLRWVMVKMKGIPIRRGAVDREAMKECTKWLKRGSVVSLFPEGTRTPDGELHECKAGAA